MNLFSSITILGHNIPVLLLPFDVILVGTSTALMETESKENETDKKAPRLRRRVSVYFYLVVLLLPYMGSVCMVLTFSILLHLLFYLLLIQAGLKFAPKASSNSAPKIIPKTYCKFIRVFCSHVCSCQNSYSVLYITC